MTTSSFRRSLLLAGSLTGVLLLLASAWLLATLSPRPVNAQAPSLASARLLALARHLATDSEQIATVDLATGLLTPLGAGLAGCCTTNVLDAALDPAGSVYYAIMVRSGENSPRIMAFDTAGGQPSFSPPLTSTLAVNYLAFDPPSGQLLALSFNAATLTTQVVRLDPASGAATVLNSLPNCCTPRAFDAAYDAETRRLYLAVTPYDGTAAPRLWTINAANGAVLADLPLPPELAVNHMAYDESSDTLWAVVYDAPGDAQRLARIDPANGLVTPIGAGVASCCALLVTDAALDAGEGSLVAPMIDTTGQGGSDIPRFYRYALANGGLLGSPPVDPAYALHYVVFDAPDAAVGTPTSSATPSQTPTPTTTRTPSVTPSPTITTTPLPPRLYLPALGGS